MKDVAGISDLTSVPDVGAGRGRGKAGSSQLRTWAKQVGIVRAMEAAALAQRADRKGFTFIELLTEAYLLRRGVRYVAQVEFGIARPDIVALDAPDIGQALILAVQGERWHEGRQYHDEGKMLGLYGKTVMGLPITKSVQVWERDILAGEFALEDALRGVAWRSV